MKMVQKLTELVRISSNIHNMIMNRSIQSKMYISILLEYRRTFSVDFGIRQHTLGSNFKNAFINPFDCLYNRCVRMGGIIFMLICNHINGFVCFLLPKGIKAKRLIQKIPNYTNTLTLMRFVFCIHYNTVWKSRKCFQTVNIYITTVLCKFNFPHVFAGIY